MDAGDQWLLSILQGIASPQLLQFIHDHVLHPDAPFQIVKRKIIAAVQSSTEIMYPLLQPFIDRLTVALYNSPDIVIVGFALVVLVLTIQVLSWIRRVSMWAAGVAFRLMFYAVVVGVAAAVWQRGLENSVKDVVVLCSKAAGFAVALKDFWLQEYKKYDVQQQRAAGAGRAGAARGRGR
ncbi:hypothetical protein UCRPA7_1081 [Phaeoacremonium minimum UCRPA7]|uniref:Uncharacterized protein n=1 Tax=Phaeoacremonium minimum (strain UCR-PA7) TaxID=1286976 RepID=R8BVT0_PHAM7|nr:hypothetical protein UCRPA7_1081 [Phaeoacremonium minimum UCRPA7]EOO03394.1 hypothetical protein UCRPA7_1081 [Phaeoacremonium minimum UCRPA7]